MRLMDFVVADYLSKLKIAVMQTSIFGFVRIVPASENFLKAVFRQFS
jgi:hypothetical protein